MIAEAATITVLGGTMGLFGARLLFTVTHATAGFLPGFTVQWGTMGMGFGIAITLGVVSGLIPAWQAARLSVVQALRRVA